MACAGADRSAPDKSGNALRELGKVRPGPEDLPAGGAEPVAVVVEQGARFSSESFGDVPPGHGFEQSVAPEAATKRGNKRWRVLKPETAQNFGGLLRWVGGSWAIRVTDH